MTNRRDNSRRWDNRGDRQDPAKGFKMRLWLVTSFFALLGCAILARAAYLQVFQHTDLSARAVSQYQKSVYLSPTRGVIYDRRWREMSANVEAMSVYAEPPEIERTSQAAPRLAGALDLPVDRVERLLASRKGFVWIKRQVTPREARSVKDLKIKGIDFFAESRRFYPHRDLASQLLGFAGIDCQGLQGVELTYDRYLRGNAGWLVVQRDALDRAVSVEGYQSDPDNRGQDLLLTIDQNIQYFAQEEIRRAVEATRSKEGLAVVMDPRNGDILAMAMSGYFNPNCRVEMEAGRWRNICLTDVYEPGSTMKPFILAAALEEGTVTPGRVYDCGGGSVTIFGKIIRDVHPSQSLSVREIIALSSNVGAIRIGQTLGREDMHRWLTSFGFGRKTGVDLPSEINGLLKNPRTWSGLSLPSISIGQEIGVTPLQLTTAYAALAGDGLLYRPRVVQGVYSAGRPVKVFGPEMVRRVVSPGTARTLKDILRQAVAVGTGKAAAIAGYSVAGKTGTAQKYDPGSGGYSTDKYLSSFAGFVPAYEPAVVILVMLDEPEGSYWGGSVAAPVFARIGERIMNYLAVPPDNPEDLKPVAGRTAEAGRAG